MAEFENVMVGFARMCKSMNQECYKRDCPLVCKAFCSKPVSAYTLEDIQEAEEIIAKWVEEHPEPEYPTWAQWFRQMEIAPLEQKCFHSWLLEHIPADIAEKLGIEPKR